MKIKILKYTFLLSLLTILAGCNMLSEDPDTLISDRITSFETSLNNGAYSDLQKHFHPDMVSYDAYLDTDIFKSGPLSSTYTPFDFGHAKVSDISGSDNKTAEGSYGNNVTTGGTYTAIMKEDGDKWKILEMVITLSGTDYTIKKLQ